MNDVRMQNQQVVLEAILAEGFTSRKDLCRITGLSASTVGLIVNQFIKQGLLLESGAGTSERGRKPITIGINGNAGTVLAIDVNEMSVGLYDLHMNPVAVNNEYVLGDRVSPNDVVNLAKRGLENLPAGTKMPLAVGISVPGEVDIETGTVVNSTNLNWDNVPLGAMVARETGLPIVVESNMVCLALTEAWTGMAAGVADFAYIHASWRGVGAGLVLNGEVHRGANLYAAEIGRLQVDTLGSPCHGTKAGGLETIACGRSIAHRAGFQATAVQDGKQTAATGELENQIWQNLLLAADCGDSKTIQALEDAATALSIAASALVIVVDPAMLVFGGRVMEAQQYIMPIIRKQVEKLAPKNKVGNLQIVVAADAREKSMAGAAHIALRSYLFSVA